MSVRFTPLALAMLSLIPFTAGAAGPARPAVVTLEDVLKETSARQKQVSTLQAEFKQEKRLALMTSPQLSSGRFTYARPDQVIWTYAVPSRLTMLISSGWLTTYYPELKKAEKLEISKYQDRIFRYMAAPGSLDELRKYFDFTFRQSPSQPHYTLELLPKTKTLGKKIRKITIWIDRETYLTSSFEYVDGEGDLTRYEFTNIRINEPVPASTFRLDLPADVRVEQVKLN